MLFKGTLPILATELFHYVLALTPNLLHLTDLLIGSPPALKTTPLFSTPLFCAPLIIIIKWNVLHIAMTVHVYVSLYVYMWQYALVQMCLPLLVASDCLRGCVCVYLLCVFVCECITLGHDSLLAASLHHQSKRSLKPLQLYLIKTMELCLVLYCKDYSESLGNISPMYLLCCFFTQQDLGLKVGRRKSANGWRMYYSCVVGGWYYDAYYLCQSALEQCTF